MRSAISVSGRPAIFRWREREVPADFVHGSARFGERERREIGDGKTARFLRRGFRGAGAVRCKRRKERATCIA